MRLVFVGTGALGLPTLRALAKTHEVLAVFTQPDRPAGRTLQLRPSPVKQLARELELPLYQPEKINGEIKSIRRLTPDAIVVAAYGQLLSKELLEIPRVGSINLHASLLPKYRGAAPIPWALIHGEQQTGVTTFLMDEGLDTGPLLLQRKLPITEEDTAGSLEKKLAELGATLMLETLQGLEAGTLKPTPQDNSQASYAPKLKKELEKIDWTKGARELFNLIRALHPAPGAYTIYLRRESSPFSNKGKRLKIHRCRIAKELGFEGEPGEVIGLGEAGPIIQTGQGSLELIEVQPEGKRKMSAMDFARGYRIQPGERFL